MAHVNQSLKPNVDVQGGNRPMRSSTESVARTGHAPELGLALPSVAGAILTIQSELLGAVTPAEIGYCAANAPRQVMQAQQIVYLERGANGRFQAKAVSSVTHIDRSSPTVLWFESMVKALDKEAGLEKTVCFNADAFAGGYQSYGKGYPLPCLIWVPWKSRDGNVIAGQIFARTIPWTKNEADIADHLAATFAHATTALSATTWRKARRRWLSRPVIGALFAMALAAMAIPVPMNALAPIEVAPRDPIIVTSGVEGAIQDVLVEPNAKVVKGQVLLQLTDTTLRNRYEIAKRQVTIAKTAYKAAAQLAVANKKSRHELATTRAELGLRLAEERFAYELLSRTQIRAEREGVVFFSDKRDLIGKPIRVGEKLMELADPRQVEFRIDLGVADSIVLKDGANVKVFLDSNPLNPIDAQLTRIGYRAKIRDNQQLSYRLTAEAETSSAANLRLGVRGTAQVFSDDVPLGFYLFRRPLAAARQWFGI